MNVIAWGPTLDAECAARHGVEYVVWDELFARADVLSIHVILSEQEPWLGDGARTELEAAVGVSGELREAQSSTNAAVVAALKNGGIAGAALDVTTRNRWRPRVRGSH